MSDRTAATAHPVLDVIADRWSPYAFAGRNVSVEDLRSIFEAARWAPSSFNEQPWRYIVARREDGNDFARVLSCLVEPNQAWAGLAPVLALGIANGRFARNDKPNGVALHDLGAASAQLTIEAGARGITVHQMGGILPEKARETFTIPDGFDAVTALAIGYAGAQDDTPDDLLARDAGERSRRPIAETVFAGSWDRSAAWTQ